MKIMRTVEDSFEIFEQLGMQKKVSGARTVYRYPSLPQKGFVEVLGDIAHYYFTNMKYHVLIEKLQPYNMDEPYIELAINDTIENFVTRDDAGLPLEEPPRGVLFMVIRPTGATGYVYINRDTYCCGCSLILRHSFCREHLFPAVRNYWGAEVDPYSILQIAGNSVLPVCAKLLVELRDCTYDGDSARLYLDGKMKELMAALVHTVATMEASRIPHFSEYERKAVLKAQTILRQNLKNPPSIRTLSSELGLNPNKMQTVFKHYSGVTVMEYLRSYRMEKALELLATDMLIEEIAKCTGYKSVSRFSESFLKTYGLLPSKYRKVRR
ncbi:MAG: helix-turn-helix transcriptional regulator [Lachnospiraceae bacterium]